MPKVLIVEDDETILALVNVYLVVPGIERFEAMDGQEGLRRAEEILPDLIVLDLKIPIISGIDVISRIRSSKNPKLRAVPILVITGASDSERWKAIEAGATTTLAKPLKHRSFRQAVYLLLKMKEP